MSDQKPIHHWIVEYRPAGSNTDVTFWGNENGEGRGGHGYFDREQAINKARNLSRRKDLADDDVSVYAVAYELVDEDKRPQFGGEYLAVGHVVFWRGRSSEKEGRVHG